MAFMIVDSVMTDVVLIGAGEDNVPQIRSPKSEAVRGLVSFCDHINNKEISAGSVITCGSDDFDFVVRIAMN